MNITAGMGQRVAEARRRVEARAIGRTLEEHAALEMALARRRQRVGARAVGRTPEEHAALEKALARRRGRLAARASPESHSAWQDHHHHPSQVKSEDDGHARSQPLDTRTLQERVGDYREASAPAQVPENLYEIDDAEIYSTFKIMHARLVSPGQRFNPYFDYAMFRAKVAAAKSGPAIPALGIPPGRKSKPQGSMRDVRGAGWHKRGYRSLGAMWINVKECWEGSNGHTRGRDVYENETLTSFVRDIFYSNASRYPEGWYCELFFKKKSVTRLLVDLENHGLDMDLVLVKDYFDGGETVYFKLFDEYGDQRDPGRYG
ncbi:hypothetical protein F4777DRAFT_381118 [Nemania sp. FL0916]|nr:hypothetical protein F4777DRAFT_381118 [Nemania sp. FL0916]